MGPPFAPAIGGPAVVAQTGRAKALHPSKGGGFTRESGQDWETRPRAGERPSQGAGPDQAPRWAPPHAPGLPPPTPRGGLRLDLSWRPSQRGGLGLMGKQGRRSRPEGNSEGEPVRESVASSERWKSLLRSGVWGGGDWLAGPG